VNYPSEAQTVDLPMPCATGTATEPFGCSPPRSSMTRPPSCLSAVYPECPWKSAPTSEQDRVIAALLPRLWRQPDTGEPFRPLQVMCDAWADGFEQKAAAVGPPMTSSSTYSIAATGFWLSPETFPAEWLTSLASTMTG
jgi:hypothetical protein